MSNPRRVQCGAPECRRRYQNDRVRRYLSDYAAEHGTRYEDRFRKDKRKSNTHCIGCGDPVGRGSTQETRCRQCWKRHLGTDRPSIARRKLARAAAGSRGTRVWTSGRCWRCGGHFLGRPANYCSPRCKRADKGSLRRAREAGAKLTPGRRWRVFERDNWACRICGDPVNRGAAVPALDAPVVDHRIPLASGGEHSPDNWQTAHFYCNSVKRDQVDFDFAEVA